MVVRCSASDSVLNPVWQIHSLLQMLAGETIRRSLTYLKWWQVRFQLQSCRRVEPSRLLSAKFNKDSNPFRHRPSTVPPGCCLTHLMQRAERNLRRLDKAARQATVRGVPRYCKSLRRVRHGFKGKVVAPILLQRLRRGSRITAGGKGRSWARMYA